MDRQAYVHKRKGRYMAQTLEDFETNVERYLPEEVAANFKGVVRRKMTALAVDACDIIDGDGDLEINGYARELRDKVQTSR